MSYPDRKLTLWQLVKRAVFAYPATLLAGLVFILLASLVQMAYFLWLPTIDYPWICALLVLLFNIYFATAVVLSAHTRWLQQPDNLLQSARHALEKLPRVLLYLAVYSGIFVLITYWLQLLNYLGSRWAFIEMLQGLWSLLLVGLPLLLINLLLLLAFPLLIVSQHSFLDCLRQSCRLAWKCRLKAVFLLYLMMGIFVYTLMPMTLHGAWLMQHHIKLLFDFVVYLIFIPLITNYMLLLLNDLKKG